MKIIFLLTVAFWAAIEAYSSRYQRHHNVEFSYDLLNDDSLEYELILPDKFFLQCENKIKFKNRLNDYIESVYVIDSILNIKYFSYIQRRFKEDSSFSFQRDKLEVLGISINLDSLSYGEYYTETIEPRVSALNGLYKFNFASRKYLCFYIQDITNPNYMLNTKILLLDITDLKQIKIVLQDLQASENLQCFGDFNNNGKLDFASWSFGYNFRDTLQLYELESNRNRFILNDTHYLVLIDSMSGYYINLNKSKWFNNTPLGKLHKFK